MRWRFIISELLFGALSAVLALVVGVVALGVKPAELALRWSTGQSDQVLHYGIFASALDTFPFFRNPQLGFPEAQNLFFAPLFDLWSGLWVQVAGLFVPDGIWALNLYNLGGFAAVGFTSYAFFRALKLRRSSAVVFGVLFATVPFHFVQLAIGHPFLANYWAVPLSGILVLIAAGERTDPFAGWVSRASTRRARLARRLVPIGVLAAAVAFTQSYYFVFGALLVGGVWAVGVVAALVSRSKLRTLLWPTVTTGTLLALIGIQLAVLSNDQGDRYLKYFGARTFADSETYGGKFIDLLLPSAQSGVLPLVQLADVYRKNSTLLLTSEGASTAIVASLAIVVSVILLLVRLFAPSRAAMDARIGVLLTAFVLALGFFITSGLGTVLSFVASPEIRAWSRMSIVVSMLALGVLALVLEHLVARVRVSRRAWTTVGVLAVVCGVGFFDQVPRIAQTLPLMPVSDSALREFTLDVEDALPPDCGVVELPLKGFPETGPMGRMGDYDEALPYVYSGDGDGDLRWSYGGVSGTASGDYWKDASTMPAAFASATTAAGACAIVVDTYAYSDNPDGWKPFVEAVGLDPTAEELTSSDIDGRYLLFELQR